RRARVKLGRVNQGRGATAEVGQVIEGRTAPTVNAGDPVAETAKRLPALLMEAGAPALRQDIAATRVAGALR
ncbi:MAG: hypothetical protein AAFR44_06595, partial [Pseudomonadota bacterium]